MLYLDYAKQTEDGYIMNFFANSVEDLEDISEGKEFVTKNGTNYGVPAPQSVVTITNKDGEKTTYLMGEDGNWIPGVVNPTDYYTKKQVDAKLEGKQDTLTADSNITVGILEAKSLSAAPGLVNVSGNFNCNATGSFAGSLDVSSFLDVGSGELYLGSKKLCSDFRGTGDGIILPSGSGVLALKSEVGIDVYDVGDSGSYLVGSAPMMRFGTEYNTPVIEEISAGNILQMPLPKLKTINGTSVTGEGNIAVESGITGVQVYDNLNNEPHTIDTILFEPLLFDAPNFTGTELSVPLPKTKTLFGNQSVLGTGNIDLYKHNVSLFIPDNISLSCNIYSSSSTEINTKELLIALAGLSNPPKFGDSPTIAAYGWYKKENDVYAIITQISNDYTMGLQIQIVSGFDKSGMGSMIDFPNGTITDTVTAI